MKYAQKRIEHAVLANVFLALALVALIVYRRGDPHWQAIGAFALGAVGGLLVGLAALHRFIARIWHPRHFVMPSRDTAGDRGAT